MSRLLSKRIWPDLAIDVDGDFIDDHTFTGATAKSTFKSRNPIIGLTGATDAVRTSGPDDAETAYSFGIPGGDPNPNGIELKKTGGEDAPGGTFAWISIVTNSISYRTKVDGTNEQRILSDANDSNIDDGAPNQGLIWPGQEFFDTPQEPVSADYTYYSRHDFFDTYLVWRSNKEDSINVALAKVSWEWGFYADATGGDWTASTGHTTLNGPIPGAVGNSLPTWSKSRWVELDGEEGAPVENGGWKATSSPAPPPLPLPN
ncbi:MAG: hypothetical protein H8E37_04685 [Planctomycetes bacterium]|nr:hypothetical protein [Planctomycetota bacterium]